MKTGEILLRDYFAAKALQCYMRWALNQPQNAECNAAENAAKKYARTSYLMADAMLAERGEVKKDLLIEDLELSVRTSNCLKWHNIKTLADIANKKECQMLRLRNFGRKSLRELKGVLAIHGLEFKK